MCIKCEKLEEYKKKLDNCKMLLRSVIDFIDEIEDSIICDNILIEDIDATYIYRLESGYDADSQSDDIPEIDDESDEELASLMMKAMKN